MPAKVKDPLKVVENTTQETFLENAFEAYLPEGRVHEKLGNIHGRKIKRLTDKEAYILKRYHDLNFKDIPDDWKSKFDNFIKTSEELAKWKKYLGNLDPQKVREKYDEPKEKHKLSDLKPADYEETKTNLRNFKQQLINFLGNYGLHNLGELEKYIKTLQSTPTLTKEQQQLINDVDKIKNELWEWQKTFKNQKPEAVNNLLNEKTNFWTSWNNIFKGKNPTEINDYIEDLKTKKPNEITEFEKNQLAEYKKWKEAFKEIKKDPALIRKDYNELLNRLSTAIKNLTSEQDRNKVLREENKTLKTNQPNPLEKAVEDKLREVVVGEEYMRPYLIKALENFLNWKGDENPEKRKIAFKYWNIIKNNIAWLQNHLNNPLDTI